MRLSEIDHNVRGVLGDARARWRASVHSGYTFRHCLHTLKVLKRSCNGCVRPWAVRQEARPSPTAFHATAAGMSEKDLRRWVSDNLHDVLGFTENHLTDFVVSLAKSAKSSTGLLLLSLPKAESPPSRASSW